MLKQLGVSTNKISQSHFLKVAFLNRSTKGAMIGFFRKAHFPNLLSAESEQK